MRHILLALLELLAIAGLAAARPLGHLGRRLLQQSTTTTVAWDLAYVPYPRLEVLCGDLVTFRWAGSTPQTVAEMAADSTVTVLRECAKATALTEATTAGEYTAELLEAGTFYFVEPSACQRGQMVTVNVACEEAAAQAVAVQPVPSSQVNTPELAEALGAAPTPAPAE